MRGAPLDHVSRETREKLDAYVAFLIEENDRQNLVSRGTLDSVWERHILDSAQLLTLAPDGKKSWADIGSGAGLPGMVTAILSGARTTLIEPRRLRVEFLRRVVIELGLTNVDVIQAKAEAAQGVFDIIAARAVAKAGDLLGKTRHLAHSGTQYLLMKGRTAQSELDDVVRAWQGEFRLVPSVTDAEAAILIASNVSPRGRG